MIRYGVVGLFVCLFVQILVTQSVAQDKLGQMKCICIDPGHGGTDPGAVGAISYEKNLALKISLKLGKLINDNYPDIKVVYTRSTDVFIELQKRGQIANANKADLFISVHINSVDSKGPTGFSTYVLGLHRSAENLRVAMKENSVIKYEKDYSVRYDGFDPSRAESYIVFSLMQNLYLEKSLLFAGLAQQHMVENTRKIDRGVEQAGWLVLKDAAMPSVLLELGFISNPNEERYLNTEEAQNKLALSIFNAVKEYKQITEKRTHVLHKPSEGEKSEVVAASSLDDDEFFYAVQIASAKTKIADYKRLAEVEEEVMEVLAGERYRYCLGKTDNYEEVKTNLRRIKKTIKDCFIIAVHRGDIIDVNKAKTLEGKLK